MEAKIKIHSHMFRYRLVIFIYMSFWWLESMVRFYKLNKIWPIMFTHWTTTMQIIDLLHKLLKYTKTVKVVQEQQSVLSRLTLSSSILVTTLFWILVLPSKQRIDPTYEITIGEIHAHGVNLLVSIFEIIYFFLLNFHRLND